MTTSVATPVAGRDTVRLCVDRRLVAAMLALSLVCYLAMALMWDNHPSDMSALYMAGRLWATGDFARIYASPDGFFGGTPPDWMALAEAWGMGGKEVLAYIYPPLWAAVLSPFAGALDPQTFFRGAAVLETLMTAGAVFLGWRMARTFAMPLWGWVLVSAALICTSLAFFMAAVLLQPQIAVVFLCLLAFERYGAGRVGQAGAVLALAATLKLAPAGLALIFLVDRNWRALGAFTAVCAGIGVLGLVVAGVDLHRDYLSALAVAGDGLYVNSVNFSAEVPMHAVGVLLGLLPAVDFTGGNVRIAATPGVIEVLGKGLALAGLVWMLWATAGLDRARRLVARLFLISMLINLFGPLGWAHYYVLQILLLPALPGLLPPRRGAVILGATGIAFSWPFFLLLALAVPGELFRACFGCLAMALLFICMTMAARSMASGRDPGATSGDGLWARAN